MTSGDRDFLSRWSQRKRHSAETEDDKTDESAGLPVSGTIVTDGIADPQADRALLEELGLKDPDDLQPGQELAAFLRAAIPKHLKQRALRRLWLSDPVLANLDGLNDYDGDFTGGTIARGELRTAYRVGKGFVDDLLGGEDTATASDRPEESIEEIAEPVVLAEAPINTDPLPEEPSSIKPNPLPEAPHAAVRHRMSFKFDRGN